MNIQQASLEHAADVAVLFDAYRTYYEQQPDLPGAVEFITERLRKGESVIYIALDNGRAIGFTQLYPLFTSVGMKRGWLLNDLYVLETYRSKGAGRALIAAAQELAKSTGSKWVMLQTLTVNTGAQRLYEKLGFEKDTSSYYYYLPV